MHSATADWRYLLILDGADRQTGREIDTENEREREGERGGGAEIMRDRKRDSCV